MKITEIGNILVRGLNKPQAVIAGCILFMLVHLISHDTIGKLLGLRSEIKRISAEVQALKVQLTAMDQQLARAKDPLYVEREAKDQLDMAAEDDLIFTFSDEDAGG